MKRRADRLRHGGPRHWAAPFVLAMLCLRALVPAGFMLAPVEGSLRVILCDSDAHAMASATVSGMAAEMPGMVHPVGADHATPHQHTQLDPTCPYAQSAGPAPPPAIPRMVSGSEVVVLTLPLPVEQTRIQFGPARLQFLRGPPHSA